LHPLDIQVVSLVELLLRSSSGDNSTLQGFTVHSTLPSTPQAPLQHTGPSRRSFLLLLSSDC
jgi:hypothetical protein